MKNILLILSTLICLCLSSNVFAGNVCSDNHPGKITICHAGNDNDNPAEPHFVNVCVDFSSVHGHLKNHTLDSVGECGTSQLLEGIAYACNAGIKHEAPSEQVCYRRSNPALTCNPSVSCSGDLSSPSCDCVCSGVNGGANNVDFMSYNGRSFTELDELFQRGDEDFWENTKYSKTSNPGQNSGSVDLDGFVVATNNARNYVLKSETLSFNLGSELFGSEYFVDICWANTNIDYAGSFDLKPKYGYKNKSFFGDTYVDTANIITKTEVECTDKSDNVSNVFDENYLMFPGQINDLEPYVGTVEDVSFCRVRHYFKEDTEAFRPWKLNAIDVTTSLEVTLTGDQTTPDKGIRLCHVIVVEDSSSSDTGNGNSSGSSSNVEVCQLGFESSADYEKFVLHHEDVSNGNSNSTYSVNHNDDYRAIVEGQGCGGTIATAATCRAKMPFHRNTPVRLNELNIALNLGLNFNN